MSDRPAPKASPRASPPRPAPTSRPGLPFPDRPRQQAGPTAAAGRFGASAAAALVGCVVTYLLLVAGEAGQRLENLALQGSALRSESERAASLGALSQVSLVTLAVAVFAVFLVGVVRGRGGLGSAGAVVMLASVLAAEVLKEVVPRPALVSGPGWLLRNSFPSGTVAAATAIAVGALLVAPERLRWAVLPVGAGYAALIAHAVQATGWHRLSDTIGSVLLVVGVSCLGLLVLAAAGLAQPSSVGRIHSRILGATVVAATVALMLGTVLIALAAAFPLLTAPEGGRRVFLQTAFPLLGAGITGLVLVLFARAIAPFSFGARGPDERTAPDATPPGTASGAGPTAADSPNEDAASRRRRRSPRSA